MTRDMASLLFGESEEDLSLVNSVSVGDKETSVIAWINSNPPCLPDHQNNCAACGIYIEVYDTGRVYLGDGALIHYGGKNGKVCWELWQQMRRDEAKIFFAPSSEQEGTR